jgi:maltooligosyltrehalose trehalohydrolase
MSWILPIGARAEPGGARFRVWAPGARQAEVLIYQDGRVAETHALAREESGYFAGHVAGLRPGARYMYRLDGGAPRPDPAGRSQPAGVHGPSELVDPAGFEWSDAGWRGVPLADMVIYELHVGTATPDGTFDALIERLDDIRGLGATAIELMPVADFPGARNWGYDGVSLFAPARAYGGPPGLRRLVDAAHARGLAVILDVVYNHLGPDGNYLREFSPAYFTSRHKTPWGDALNFDGPDSGPVREFIIGNALHWAHEYHVDGLRLDATHAILDDSPTHVLAELAERVRESLPPDRAFVIIAENENNDPGVVGSWETRRPGDKETNQAYDSIARSPSLPASLSHSSWGLDAVWADDFHHQVRVALTGEQDGYYADYAGTAADLAATLNQGWFYTGQAAASGRARGAPADAIGPEHFVYCIQNHDQVGNRALGDRLGHAIDLAAYRAASALLLLSPYTPLIWMGQEWAASAPFLYFTDHEPELGRLVTEGRRSEFAGFSAFGGAEVPDPQANETFERSKLRWDERGQPPHEQVLRLYRVLLDMRARLPALRRRDRASFTAFPLGERALGLRREGQSPADELLLVASLGGALRLRLGGRPELEPPAGYAWAPLLDTERPEYGGAGEARLASGSPPEISLSGAGAVLFGAHSMVQ